MCAVSLHIVHHLLVNQVGWKAGGGRGGGGGGGGGERKSENIENRPTEAEKRIFFFLFSQKKPFGYLFSEMTSKGSISFSSLRNL